jgi:hypothetical protein
MKVNYANSIAAMFGYLRESDSCTTDPETGEDIEKYQVVGGLSFHASNSDGLLNLNGNIESYELDYAFDHVNIQNRYLKNFILDYLDSIDISGKDGFIEVDSLAEIERSFLEGGQVRKDFMELVETKIEELEQRLIEVEQIISQRETEIDQNREAAAAQNVHQLPPRMESVPFDIIIEQKNSTEQLMVLQNFRVRLQRI